MPALAGVAVVFLFFSILFALMIILILNLPALYYLTSHALLVGDNPIVIGSDLNGTECPVGRIPLYTLIQNASSCGKIRSFIRVIVDIRPY